MPPPDPATHADTVALFRYGLIADLLHLSAGDRSLRVRLREKAAREPERRFFGLRWTRLTPAVGRGASPARYVRVASQVDNAYHSAARGGVRG